MGNTLDNPPQAGGDKGVCGDRAEALYLIGVGQSPGWLFNLSDFIRFGQL